MSITVMNSDQGHWMLAKIGKRVLRPGGKELTRRLLTALNISASDDVVEFAPGIGFTARQVLKYHPGSYTGIEVNEEAANNLRKKIKADNCSIRLEDATVSQLKNESASKLFGEAMLTMQANHRKSKIIEAAFRILKNGGLYAIHELCITPDNLPADSKETIRKDLAKTLKVNARPLTASEWVELIENAGFRVKTVFFSPMKLLEVKRIVDDEGFLHTMKIGLNVARQPDLYKRLKAMRALFRKYRKELKAIAIVAEKPRPLPDE